MTNEDENLVRKKVEQAGMKFPVVRTSGNDADRSYKVRGYPSSFLVDRAGALVWSGHPAELTEASIEALLSGG